jgi:hypothetical protein
LHEKRKWESLTNDRETPSVARLFYSVWPDVFVSDFDLASGSRNA